ncbi:MAG: PEP-CTERM sorting domain-containing protein [Colwellia sp.]|nr:PEP-CTERM sorting domain-containing protein [Colwellia sp.]
MLKTIRTAILSLALLGASSITNATLITNGSFEQTRFTDNSTSFGAVFNTNLQSYENKRRSWDVFYTLPGWMTVFGNGIELQKNVVTRSQHGEHHIELDSYKSYKSGSSNSVMTQTIDSLTVGEDYLLEFYYKPRTNSKNDNGINVFWQDSSINFDINMQASFVADGTSLSTPKWIKQSTVLTANADSMNLSFGSFGRQNTLGGLVDNVSLTRVSSVPEPATIVLLLLGFTFLIARKRKQLL